jgi:GTP-binding protein
MLLKVRNHKLVTSYRKLSLWAKKPIVVINKVDKPNCRPDEVQESVFELMFNLEASEDQLDFPTVYGSAKQGWMSGDWLKPTEDITHLLDVVLEHVPPPAVSEGTPQLQITNIDYSKYIGRMAIGRVTRGTLYANQPVSLVKRDGKIIKSRIKTLYTFEGLGKTPAEEVRAGDLAAVFGIEGFEIGDTIADFENPEGMAPISIDEPTMSMLFTINDSPFFGKEGKFVTSRHLRDRLYKEMEKNLALRVDETGSPDSYMVFGRGILHLSVLIETMRREGYEFQIGKPRVIVKEIDGRKCEPIEILEIDVPEHASGKVIELVAQRKGDMLAMNPKGDLTRLEFEIPSRGLIGLRTQILNATAGEAIVTHRFKAFEAWRGDIPSRNKGVLIVMETGTAIAYAMDKLQDRGRFFLEPGVEIYEGQIAGENNRDNDLVINITKTKKLTNMRASGTDDKAKIAPPVLFSLEQSMEYIGDDEYVEITPVNIRMRKIYLKEHERKRSDKTEMA